MESNDHGAPAPAPAETDNFENTETSTANARDSYQPITTTTNANSGASVSAQCVLDPTAVVTSSRSAESNANADEITTGNSRNGKQDSKLKSKGSLTAPPSRRPSLFQNLVKIYPFSLSMSWPDSQRRINNEVNSNTNVNANMAATDEEQHQRECSDELCMLKAVAPLPDDSSGVDGSPPRAKHSGTKSPSRRESIANMIQDINRKESHLHVQEGPANENEPAGGTVVVVRCSGSASTEGFCRICHDNPSKMTLIAPCSCKGSMGLVHRTCLERWLGESGKQNCEVCKTEFIIERRPRYTGCSSIYQWIKSPLSPTDTRNLFFDLACFLVLTPLALVSAWLCIVVIIQDSKNGNIFDLSADRTVNGHRRNRGFWRNTYSNDPNSTTWTSIGLLTLTGTLLAAYYVWLYVAFRYHLQIWREWQRHNYVVTIVPVTANRDRRDRAPASSSAQAEDRGGHRSDPGTRINTGSGSSTAAEESSRERTRSLSIGRRLEKGRKHSHGKQFMVRQAARFEAQRLAAVAEMNPLYNLSYLNEYHALLMASVNYNEDSSSSSSFSLRPSSTSSSEASTPTPQQPNSAPAATATTVIDTPDREVIIIEPEPSVSLPNFRTEEELEVRCANCRSTSITAIVAESTPIAADNNENSQIVQVQSKSLPSAPEVRT